MELHFHWNLEKGKLVEYEQGILKEKPVKQKENAMNEINDWINIKGIQAILSHSSPWAHKSFVFRNWNPGRNMPSATGQE